MFKFLLIFAGGMSLTYFLMNREDKPDLSKLELKPIHIETADFPDIKKKVGKVLRTQTEIAKDNFTAIYNRLGLRHGDMIKKVDNVSVLNASASVFSALAAGFKRGNVCVTYERNGEERQTCLKSVKNEDVVDRPVSAN